MVKTETFGERLRTAREARNLTQSELAAEIESTPQAVWNLENGRSNPSVRLLSAIASALGISIDRLIQG